ncbi:MAG: hypothetical protein JWO73_683 [Candidatus Taylorbacteria bacterium]|nr:hypothetical protein [Candidatus Taylorbacteria bacterium]
MSFEFTGGTDNRSESEIEQREKLKQEFSLALCTKQKEGGTADLESQASFVEQVHPSGVQFDFRNRSIEEIEKALETLKSLRERMPEMSFSIHGDTPKIDEQNFGMKNHERTEKELEILQLLQADTYTVHPPSVSEKLFSEAQPEIQEKIIDAYCGMFASKISDAIQNGGKFSIAIENMPTKGEDGAWGQRVEDIDRLMRRTSEILVEKYEVDPAIVGEYIGATLDVNHTIHDLPSEEMNTVLDGWFRGLGEYLKVVHLYTPSNAGPEFSDKYKLVLDLASKYNPNARLYLESKQDEETTRNVFAAAKEIE